MSTSVPPIDAATAAADHPVSFDVDYPDRPLDRVSTLLRPFAALPIPSSSAWSPAAGSSRPAIPAPA
jgi:hypothetical protein